MADGHPLTDADRWDWLIRLRDAASATLGDPSPSPTVASTTSPSGAPASKPSAALPGKSSPAATAGAPRPHHRGCVVTCSALRQRYRDVLRMPVYFHADVAVHFVFLQADEAELQKRVARRRGHYMKPGMVRSQLDALEVPDGREQAKDVVVVDCARDRREVQAGCLMAVREILAGVGR